MYATLSHPLRGDINQVLRKLYSQPFSSAKESLNGCMIDVEQQRGSTHVETIQLTKKLMFDLRNYSSLPDALWLLTERCTRHPQDRFENFILTQSMFPCQNDHSFSTLLQEEQDPFKLLIMEILMASWYYTDQKNHDDDLTLISYRQLRQQANTRLHTLVHRPIKTEQETFLLCYALIELGFLSKMTAHTDLGISYLTHAITLLDQMETKPLDLELNVHYYLLKYQLQRGKQVTTIPKLVQKMNQYMMGNTSIVSDFKPIRQLFYELGYWEELTQDYTYHHVFITLGRTWLKTLATSYGLELTRTDLSIEDSIFPLLTSKEAIPAVHHPDVLFLLAQLLGLKSVYDRRHVDHEDILSLLRYTHVLKETTRHDYIGKIHLYQILIKLCRRYRLLKDEVWCHYQNVRLHDLCYGKHHYRSINPLKHLAIALDRQGQKEECHVVMTEAIFIYSRYPKEKDWKNTKTGKDMLSYLHP